MARESKRKLLHYRKASFFSPLGKTLQELIEEALGKLDAVSTRVNKLEDGTDDGWQRFINMHRAGLGMQFGNLVLYAPNQARHIITLDDTATELDISLIAPPKGSDGKNRQFLESLLYYGIQGNHIILLQSMALKARDLEQYLNWLLVQAGVIGDDNAVFLNNYVPTVTQERLEHAEVKSVRVGTPLVNSDVLSAIEVPGDDTKKIRFKQLTEGWQVLRTLVSDRVSDLSWSEMQAASNLEVFVEVTYKRQADEQSQKALNRISAALRHVSDEDIRIELKGGGTVVGTDLQVKNYMNVDTYNGVVEPTDLFGKMQSWLVEILEKGLVDAD